MTLRRPEIDRVRSVWPSRADSRQRGWHVSTTTAPRFSHVSIADVGPAIAEGRRLNTDDVLRFVLGEFLEYLRTTHGDDAVVDEPNRLRDPGLVNEITALTVRHLLPGRVP